MLSFAEQFQIMPPHYLLAQQENNLNDALAQGFTIHHAGPRQITLDLDDETAEAYYNKMLPMVQRYLALTETDRWTSKSGNGRHVVLESERVFTTTEALLLQAILGSDVKREFLSFIRSINGEPDEDIRLLFRPPEKRDNDEVPF